MLVGVGCTHIGLASIFQHRMMCTAHIAIVCTYAKHQVSRQARPSSECTQALLTESLATDNTPEESNYLVELGVAL